MSNLLLDTNILLLLVRNPQNHAILFRNYPPTINKTISVVTEGEIQALAIKLSWGANKKIKLESLLDQLLILPIQVESIIQAYGKIDAFSQGKLSNQPLSMTARNMGKNDLWIAATAYVTQATLMTTDNDFDHLQDHFLNIEKIKIENFRT